MGRFSSFPPRQRRWATSAAAVAAGGVAALPNLVAGSAEAPPRVAEAEGVADASPAGEQVNAGLTLLAVGDWGGVSDDEPTTTGQEQTAKGMWKAAQRLDAKGVLLLGDNFYETGVESCQSDRFRETFEEVYKQTHFLDLPFYVIAGNHDHKGDVMAQVNYHDESGRWHFPALNYSLSFNFSAPSGARRTAELLMIDTVELTGNSDSVCKGCKLPGPLSVERAEDQWSWIEEQLRSSEADFLLVAGHYPIYSAGQDGTTEALVHRLLPLLRAHGAHYLSGHDHMVQHLVHDGVQMFLSGMGRECCYEDENRHTVPDGALKFMLEGKHGKGKGGVGPRPKSKVHGGFVSVSFGDALSVTYFDQDGETLYAAPPVPPRSADRAIVV